MKKKNLKSLKLNKKSISNFQIKGGALPGSIDYSNCAICEESNHICEPYSAYPCNFTGDIVLNTVWENGMPSRCQYSEHPTI